MKIDLHTHTSVSDGVLSPEALLDRAVEMDVDMLSITDHDSIAAYKNISSWKEYPLRIIPGIEFSTQWCGVGVHIIGLNFNLKGRSIIEGVASQSEARGRRSELIAERLTKAGLRINFERVQEIANFSNVGRPHFAQYMVEAGLVNTSATAFNKYLGDGKIGDVKQCWAELPQIISWIVESGGVAVIAHPLKYKMTRSKLIRLVDDFKQAGGLAMEVVSGTQTKVETNMLTRLCQEKSLLASCGSDFHQPTTWSELGKITPFSPDCEPVWSLFD